LLDLSTLFFFVARWQKLATKKKPWWWSLMREGSGDGNKFINNGSRSTYNESDDTATLQKTSPSFWLFFFSFNFFFMPTGSVSKNEVTIWRCLATKKLLIPRAQEYVLCSIYLHIIGNATRISTKVQFCLSIRQKGSQNKPSYDICCELWPFQLLLIKKDTNGEREVQNEDDHSPKFSTWWYFWVLFSKDYIQIEYWSWLYMQSY
jgi:hypothetical protein